MIIYCGGTAPDTPDVHAVEHTRSDMALLETRKESRDVFLKVFRNSIPTMTRGRGLQGKICFEDGTIIRVASGVSDGRDYLTQLLADIDEMPVKDGIQEDLKDVKVVTLRNDVVCKNQQLLQ